MLRSCHAWVNLRLKGGLGQESFMDGKLVVYLYSNFSLVPYPFLVSVKSHLLYL